MKKKIVIFIAILPILFLLAVILRPVETGQWLYDTSMAAEASLYGFTEQSIPIGEMNMSVYRNNEHLGSDKPTILMLHGYSAEKTVWLRFAKHFTDDFNIIIPDMAGHGKTGFDASWSYTGPAQAARLIALLDRLQIQQVHVIGNSMGGFIAGHLANLYPERTLSATFVDPAGVESPEPSVMGVLLAQGENPFLVETPEAFFKFYDMTMAQPPFVPDVVKLGVAERYIERREALRSIFADFYQKDPLDDILPKLNIPSLIMWGGKDELIHISSAKVWQDKIPNSELEIWPEIGHMPMVEIPTESAQRYQTFLDKLY